MRALILTLALLGLAGPARAFASGQARVVISIDLSKNTISIFKYRANATKPIAQASQILTVVPGSVKAGTYLARVPSYRNPRERTATRLDNAILFDGMRMIRSSAHFDEMKTHPVAGSVVTPGDFGGLLFKAVEGAGGKATIVIRG